MPTATNDLAPLPPPSVGMFEKPGVLRREWYIWMQSVDSVLRGLREEAARGSLALTDGMPAPAAVAGEASLFVDAADGDLKVRFANAFTKTISTDT